MIPVERLLQLLRSLPDQIVEREIDFIRLVVPPLTEILGYSANETFYEYRIERRLADVVLSASITSKPWIVLELKKYLPRNTADWFYQLKYYLDAFDNCIGAVLSPQMLLLSIDGRDAERFDLRTITREQAEQLYAVLRRKAQLPAVEQSESNNPLIPLIEAAEKATTANEKGKTFEEVAKFVLESVPSLRCKYTNLYTRSSEIDIVVEYDRSRGGIPLFDELGRYALIECKNWSKPVGVGPVRDFMGKLDKCKARMGIIFARNGVTGVDAGVDALREIQSRFDRDGVFLVVFSLEELRAIKNGLDFVAALDQKADTLRFDAELA
ncbi:restriction endonuclease [Leptolyngbya sp. GB1-A1]|uniref:restriction endonuclease n=1 Tax=Leptolyngbya sp. GB1-A1 TaxID=2933908 RepID=UPI0032978A09